MKALPPSSPSVISTSTRARQIATRCGLYSDVASPMAAKRSKLQLLFDLAQRTFAERGQPTSPQVDVLKLALSSVPLAELGIQHSEECACAEESCPGRAPPSQGDCSGLQQFDPDAYTGPRPAITYLHIHEDENLSLGIFCLPCNAQIPLHNHPGMTVMSRVLYGKMHVKSYDWAGGEGGAAEDGAAAASAAAAAAAGSEASGSDSGGSSAGAGGALPRPAHLVLDRVFTAADEPAVLFPSSGGNIHQFTAVTDCAVLDLLSPPYSTDDGRDCTYYAERQGPAEEGGVVLLAEQEPPAEFTIESGAYKGLPIRSRPYLLRSILQAAAAAAQSTPSASPGVSHSQPAAGVGSKGGGEAEVSSSSAAGTASPQAAGGGPTWSGGLGWPGGERAPAGALAPRASEASQKSPGGKPRRGAKKAGRCR